MNPTRSLKISFLWVFAGNSFYAAAQFILVTLVAREMGPVLVGKLTLCLAILTPLLQMSSMQLPGILATDARGDYEFGHYWGLRLVLVTLIPIGALISTWLVDFDRASLGLLAALSVMKVLEGIADVPYAQLRRSDHMNYVGITRGVRGILMASVSVVGLLVLDSLLLALIGTCILWTVTLVFFELPVAFRAGAQRPSLIPLRRIRHLFVNALPMAGVMMINAVSVQIPVYVLVGYWGEKVLGHYAAVAQFLIAFTLMTGPMGLVVAPRFAVYFFRDQKRFWALFWKLQFLSLTMGAFAMVLAYLIGDRFLDLVLGREFAHLGGLLALLGMVAGVQQAGAFWGVAATASRIFHRQFVVRVLSLVVVTLASLLLIRRWGEWAMPWVLMCGPIVSCALYYPLLRKEGRRVAETPETPKPLAM